MTERLLFSAALVRLMPPWLQRTVGARVVRGLADPIDTLVENTVAAVKARFPSSTDESALARIGAERRIRRGPGESATTYARRIRTWWDAHRTRGGPYAMLAQLDAFFQDWLNVRMDLVSNLGVRHWIDAAAELEDSVITRDTVAWTGDGSGLWARLWVFFYVGATIPFLEPLTDDDGTPLTTDDGTPLVAAIYVAPGALSDVQEEIFKTIPREWRAAHIDWINVVLLYGDACLVGYPPRLIGDNPPDTVTPTDAAAIFSMPFHLTD